MSYDLISALNVMWQGMLGIFVVMGIISIFVAGIVKSSK
ncbi:MAG: sodium pump decarboxylase gamma subunit [Ruminococcaceae bacterium]|nr:sodium pump decarboxylase gamma subunit [Oscillospiraceae bacterium]